MGFASSEELLRLDQKKLSVRMRPSFLFRRCWSTHHFIRNNQGCSSLLKSKRIPNFSSAKIKQRNSPSAAQSHLTWCSSLVTRPSDFVFQTYLRVTLKEMTAWPNSWEICTLLVMWRITAYWFWQSRKISTVNGSNYPYTFHKNLKYFMLLYNTFSKQAYTFEVLQYFS